MAGNPTIRRRQLAAELRDARKAAGISVEDAASALDASTSKISRVETGQHSMRPLEVRELCRIYGVSDERTEQLVTLAREGGQKVWWQSLDLRRTYSTYIGLENSATAIWNYQTNYIPGLLQTEDYARAVIRGTRPTLNHDEVERLVKVRMDRQDLLQRPDAPDLWLVVDEAAVRRQIGGRVVMAAQLASLAERANVLPNLNLQVMPYRAGAHPGMDGSFVVLEFAEPGMTPTVFIEGPGGDVILERDEDVRRFTLTYGHLRARALDPQDTLHMLADLGTDHGLD
jgi:transcriptional regulator with XRE-family HTH domain